MPQQPKPQPRAPFRLAIVPGTAPDKWVHRWQEAYGRHSIELLPITAAEQLGILRTGMADAALGRTPIADPEFHSIALYEELTVAVMGVDDDLSALDSLTTADLADRDIVHPKDEVLDWSVGHAIARRPATTKDAIEAVAASGTLTLTPQSLARLHHRKDVTYRPVPDAPSSGIALVWLKSRDADDVQDLAGIVRGRTARSSRR